MIRKEQKICEDLFEVKIILDRIIHYYRESLNAKLLPSGIDIVSVKLNKIKDELEKG